MKKLSLLKNALMAAAVLMLASCGNDESVDPTTDFNVSNPASVLKGLEISKLVFDGEELIFTYDDNGKLEKVTSAYSETDDWGSWASESAFSFVYANDKLTSVNRETVYTETPAGGETQTYSRTATVSYTYHANDLVSEINHTYTFKDGDGQTREDSYLTTLEYNAENKVVKETESSTEGSWKYWSTYEWNGENVVKQRYYSESSTGGRMQARMHERKSSSFLSRLAAREPGLEEEVILSDFDDKMNPLTILSVMQGYFSAQLISKNNPKKLVEFDTDENGNLVQEEETTVVLEYDSKGRPTKYTITEVEEGDVDVEEITITYKN